MISGWSHLQLKNLFTFKLDRSKFIVHYVKDTLYVQKFWVDSCSKHLFHANLREHKGVLKGEVLMYLWEEFLKLVFQRKEGN